MADGEVTKLQKHLSLIREEYTKLQSKFEALEKKYAIVTAGSEQEEDSYVSRLLAAVGSFYNTSEYSDMTIKVDGQEILAHKFVLLARSNNWDVNLCDVSVLTLHEDITYDVGVEMFRWVYSDEIDVDARDSDFLLLLLKAASTFHLAPLMRKCEVALTSHVTVKNCINFYQTADEIEAGSLKEHCSELISNHWDDFSSEDFVNMPAALLYQMFKEKSKYPLHRAIKAHREDVVFLFIIEFGTQLDVKCNERDLNGFLPLEIALLEKQRSTAETLVKNHADLSVLDHRGQTLLHRALLAGDQFSCTFYIENGLDVNQCTYEEKHTALHTLIHSPLSEENKVSIAKLLLENAANANMQDYQGRTALHLAVTAPCRSVFDVLLTNASLNLDLEDNESHSVLWLAMLEATGTLDDDCMAAHLISKGCTLDAISIDTGNSILHTIASRGHEEAAIFMAQKGASLNLANKKGNTVLHIAAQKGLLQLVKVLLARGANPNSQTYYIKEKRSDEASSHDMPIATTTSGVDNPFGSSDTNPFADDDRNPFAEPAIDYGQPFTSPTRTHKEISEENEIGPSTLQTPLHLAIVNHQEAVIEAIIQHKDDVLRSKDNSLIIPNFTLKDSKDQTALAVALWAGLHAIARKIMIGGASVNDKNAQGLTLLHQAIKRQDSPSCVFLLDNQANSEIRTSKNETVMELAINKHLPGVVTALCSHRVPANQLNSKGDPVLWQALEEEAYGICDVLVDYKCDINVWHSGEGGCLQNLLHRAIDENKQKHACYLIEHGCDVNSPRKPGLSGEGGEEARDGQTPLHLASSWGLEDVVQRLIISDANVNAQDSDGKSALHIAIANQQPKVTYLLLSHPSLDLMIRDKTGWTPFATAMTMKDNKAAQAILDRAPTAADQFDNRGRNFLHVAVLKADIESVLFLISVNADVNSLTRDASKLSPLLLAVKSGSEIIVRNLLLAGAKVSDLTVHRQTALHLAAEHNHTAIMSVLIENSVNFTAVDDDRNDALHVAVYHGNLNACKVLLTETTINAEAVNLKGQNALHILGHVGKENGAAIFDLFINAMPNYPINQLDMDGNSVLLLAYMNGNSNLCRAAVRVGVCLGQSNKQSVNIFNAPVATKALLFKLLDMLSTEPPWAEGENCLECGTKFGIKTRRHHCRHCGRLLCAKCSGKDMPIIKFSLNKPVRVCDTCFDVLTLGT